MTITIGSDCFSGDTMAGRFEYTDIPYNTKIIYPENCSVVVVTNGEARRLKTLDDGVINAKKTGIFGRKKDPRRHIVYCIDNAYHDTKWGGNIEYEDKKTDGVQEKVFIRASFTFRIEGCERFLPLLSGAKEKYDQRYVEGKIRSKMDNTIKQCVFKVVQNKGFVKSQECILDILRSIMDALNEDVLSIYGVTVSNFNLVLEEEEKHATERNTLEWNEWKKKKEGN